MSDITLTGTEKQVAWAQQIRAERLDPSTYHESLRPFAELALRVVGAAAGKVTSAAEWIVHRDHVLQWLFALHYDLSEEAAREVYITLSRKLDAILATREAGEEPSVVLTKQAAKALIRACGSEEKARMAARDFGFTFAEGESQHA